MTDNNDLHPLDQWDEDAKKSQAAFQKQAILDSSLLYAVFSTPQGKQLIARWTDHLIHSATAVPGCDMITIGMNEGQKTFIRGIITNIKLFETKTHE